MLAITGLLILLVLSRCVPTSGSYAAVLVYDHGFTNQVTWVGRGNALINKTSYFTQDDQQIVAYAKTAFYNASFTWQFYDPNGHLYSNTTEEQTCNVAPCTIVNFFPLRNTPAAILFGEWRLNLLANGYLLYSDNFWITPIITQNDYWKFNVTQSAPARVHGELTVTIHPDNQTFSQPIQLSRGIRLDTFYQLSMPYAANITASEAVSNRRLSVVILNNTNVYVDLGPQRPDGYTFVINFDLVYGVRPLNGWVGGTFAFTWIDEPFDRSLTVYPVPETFNITLPEGTAFADLVGMNVLVLEHKLRGGHGLTISFAATVPPLQPFGWTLIYRDFTWLNLNRATYIVATTSANLASVQQQLIPVLPLTLGSMSLWTAIMSVFLLIGSELLSPAYARTGILINRRRLRIAALVLVGIFLAITAYQIMLSRIPVTVPHQCIFLSV